MLRVRQRTKERRDLINDQDGTRADASGRRRGWIVSRCRPASGVYENDAIRFCSDAIAVGSGVTFGRNSSGEPVCEPSFMRITPCWSAAPKRSNAAERSIGA